MNVYMNANASMHRHTYRKHVTTYRPNLKAKGIIAYRVGGTGQSNRDVYNNNNNDCARIYGLRKGGTSSRKQVKVWAKEEVTQDEDAQPIQVEETSRSEVIQKEERGEEVSTSEDVDSIASQIQSAKKAQESVKFSVASGVTEDDVKAMQKYAESSGIQRIFLGALIEAKLIEWPGPGTVSQWCTRQTV